MSRTKKYLVIFTFLTLCFSTFQMKVFAYDQNELKNEVPPEFQEECNRRLSNKKERMTICNEDSDSGIDLYAIDDCYEPYLSIPDSYARTYQLKEEGENPTYAISSGDSVTVSETGLIEPAYTTWYYVDDGSTSYWTTSYIEGAKTKKEMNFGTSVVEIRTSSESRFVTVVVHDYAQEYAEKVMDDYYEEQVDTGIPLIDQLDMIAKFPTLYDYSSDCSGYVGMIVTGGGDCWASSSAILYLCDKAGIQAHLRYGVNDSGAGSGHRNVAALVDGFVYVADAGYDGMAPRMYTLTEENIGFMCEYSSSDHSAKIIQYDGFDSEVVIPSTLDGYEVTTIGKNAFYIGERFSDMPIKSVSLPDTLTTLDEQAFSKCENLTSIYLPEKVSSIGEFAFTECRKLEQIHVSEKNQMFSSQEGVLFDKKGETLLVYPYNGEEEYTIPDGVKSIMDYAFYLTIKPDLITIPKSITEVGFGAFGDCSVDKIYFYGKRPEIGEKAFKGDSLIAYYPKGDNSWEKIENETYEAESIEWKSWNVQAIDLKLCDVTVTPSEYIYCGEECKPDVVVKHGDIILKQGIDYEVSYKDNVDSGTGLVLISALDGGDYKGSLQTSFTIQKKDPVLAFQDSELTVTLLDGEVSDKEIINPLSYETDGNLSYISSDEKIASVSSEGYLSIYNTGSCIITVTAEEGRNYSEKSLSYTLYVKEVKSQELIVPSQITKTYGDDNFKIPVTVQDQAPLHFRSEDTDIASVSSDGTVTIHRAGTVQIIVTADATDSYSSASASTTLIIQKKDPVLAFQDSELTVTLLDGEVSDKEIINPLSYETDGNLSYISSDEKIASVSSEGYLSIYNTGSCIITVTAEEGRNYSEKSLSYTLYVKEVKSQKLIVPSQITKTYGDDNFKIPVTVQDQVPLHFRSEDTDIASVSSDGTVTIHRAGAVQIIVTADATNSYSSASVSITLTIQPKSIEQCKIVFKEIRSYPLYTDFNMDYFVVLDENKVLYEDVDFQVLSLGSFSQSQGTNVSSEIEVEIRGLDNYFGIKTEKLRSINKEPKLVSASRSSDGVKLGWEKESGALGYIVYRKIGSGNFEKIYTTSSNDTTSWMDKNISNDKISYYIKTYTTDGRKYIYSDRSNIKSVEPAFSIRSLSNTTKGIELTWSKVSGATRYEIYRKTSGQNFRKIKTIVKGTTFTDVSVKNGSGYSYKVRANGRTKISSPEKKIVRLTTPSITSAKNVREKSIYLKWRKNSRASGYQIRYTTGSSKRAITVKKSSSVAKTISRLKKGKIYQVSVRSYRTVSGVTYYSDYCKIKRVKIYK